MRLKRLTCRGFKSFADRTEFEFDNRLTGIIGPNGCGKSNVVDAIKWVLGDQRAKSLRGTEMTDVIFKGAEGREAMGMAEVTITFEDPDAAEGRSEIAIGRRLTLDKESTYLLNGEEVRLKDVRDMLLDTGLGTGGYSVMEQGRIDAVLSANPEARRAIFEEAAGVARFKLQKKEALRKLERTDQNLARVTDLLEERSRRIRSLRIQAGKARRWHELQGSLRDLRAALAVVEGRTLREAMQAQAAALTELQLQLEHTEDAREEAALQLAQSDDGIAACAAALSKLQDELHRCQSELSTLEERGQGQALRQKELRAEVARGQERSQGLVQQRDERAAELSTVRDSLAGKEGELIELHRRLGEQREATQAAQARQKQLQQAREGLRHRSLELLHQRTRARNQAHDQSVRKGAAVARQQRLAERTAVLQLERDRVAGEDLAFSAEQQDQRTRERLLTEREQLVMGDLRTADVAAAELMQQASDLQRELSAVEGRQQALLSMEAHHEGLDQGPKHVLQSAPDGLRGRLLDLLEIDLAYSAALEAALGDFVQALVIDNRDHAEAIVASLQEGTLGRVLLLVEDEFGTDLEQPSLLPLPDGARFLLDLVRDTQTAPEDRRQLGRRMLAWLLRGVVLVDSLSQADPHRPDLCFVTPDGTLLCGPRVEGGASAEGHAGLVVRRSQIQKLGEQAAVLHARLQELETGKESAAARADRLKAELDAVAKAVAQVRRRGHEIEGQLTRLRAREADLCKEHQELELEDGELRRTRFAAIAALGWHLLTVQLIARQEAAVTAQEANFGDDIHAAQTAAEACVRAEQETRLSQAQTAEAREGLLRSIRMHEEAGRELEQTLQELQDRMQTAAEGADRAEREVVRVQEQVLVLEDQLTGLEEHKLQRSQELDAARQLRGQHQRTLQEWDEKRSSLQEQSSQARLTLADCEHRFLRLEERLREDTEVELLRLLGEVEGIGLEGSAGFYGPPCPLDLVECLQGPPLPPAQVAAWYALERLWETAGFEAAEARKEVQVLQAQKDRLGAVNLDAVRELDEEEGQFGSLEQEVADLKDARRSLMDTLRKLEVESKLLFEQTFSEARKNFQEIFRKLFQGGKADMFLGTDSESALEAGIEIVAQPPGKQLQSINLLSGGERSLTAVAILFALFKVRPSPFCILDEVDAALDETNVERFLRVLRDFVTNTQFCIVTHHKRTMADCQVLYGITMQRRGISSRIAVNLTEVDSFQEGAVVVAGRSDPAQKRRIAGEEQVGFD